MNLLVKNIRDISFEDVVEFCKEGILEGTQLDYKLKMPNDLAKHFATFSNTQGGLIILGVGEDANGLPDNYVGLPNDGKLVDQIHQIAANVSPLPTYDTCTTTPDKNGNMFGLIRIFEGAAAPYTTLSDPTVWIRNGNISTRASREELLRLANKRENATSLRSSTLALAKGYFEGRVEAAEQERKQLAALAQEPNLYQYKLGGENAAILHIALQPYYPEQQLVRPDLLVNNTHDYYGQEFVHSQFNYSDRTTTMPGAITAFSWNKQSGQLGNEQLYTNGLLYLAVDVLKVDRDAQKQLTIPTIGHHLHRQLVVIKHYYRKIGYSGLVEGKITLEGGFGATVIPISYDLNPLYTFDREMGQIYLPSYDWTVHFDTNILNDEGKLNALLSSTLNEISWSLGAGDVPSKVMDRFLEMNGWKKSTENT